jgi:ABC-type nitrate/sulfonate/bicarbonate transport system substrate-binding protein
MVTFVISSSPEQICRTKSGGYISRPDIASVKDLKGKRLAINTFGSSADFAIYQLLSRNGLDLNKDVTLLSIAGSPDARFAAHRRLGRCQRGEQPVRISRRAKGFKVLLSIKSRRVCQNPINGLSTSQRKIDREPDEIVRMLRALRNANLFLQNQREISVGLVEKVLKLERPVAERFYALYREQFNPDLTVPDAVVEEWISVGTFRAKEKITAKPQQVVDWMFAESPTLIIKSKRSDPRDGSLEGDRGAAQLDHGDSEG